MLAIWKREIQNYFLTPIGYVFMGVLLLAGGFFFFLGNLSSASSNLANMFSNLGYLFMLMTPILTMKLLSEEKRSKTDQLLLTAPRSIRGIVLGKFFAACTVLLCTLAVTLLYIIVIAVYGTPYWGQVFANYFGFFLLGCCYIAIGVLMSALTENQVSAVVLALGVNLMLQLLENYGPQLNIPYLTFLPKLFAGITLYKRFATFAAGMISIADIVYYLSFCAVCLFFAIRVIDKRRWSEG